MKKLLIVFALFIGVVALAACSNNTDDTGKKDTTEQKDVDLELPSTLEGLANDKKVYLTTIGQGPEYEIVSTMLSNQNTGLGLEGVVKDNALTADQVEEGSVVVIVPGASSKGLTGQFDKDSEEARANAFSNRAAKGEIEIIVIHNGGEGRRGALSDTMITNSSKEAAVLLVLQSGNSDGFFDTLSDTNAVAVYYYTSNSKLIAPLRQLFE